MNRRRITSLLLALASTFIWATFVCFTADAQEHKLLRAAPVNAYIVVHGRHNPERDYQREYWRDVWETARETRLGPRLLEIITSQVSEEDRQRATEVLEEFQQALEPFDQQAILDAQEVLYAGIMEIPMHQSLLCIRMTPEAAKGSLQALGNLMELAEKYSDGEVQALHTSEGEVEIELLKLPEEVPLRPSAAAVGDVFVVSTSEDLVRETVRTLQMETSESKLDDPRIKEALSKLPEPEDALVVFDGKQYFNDLGKVPELIRQHAGDDQDAQRAAQLVEEILRQVSILDYIVSVEYTDGFRNLSEEYGRLSEGADDKVLTKMFGGGEPFENWSRFVPADSVGFSLSTCVDLHPLYQWITEYVPTVFPEFQGALDELHKLEEQHDVYLDRDILQNFPGPTVTVHLPPQAGGLMQGQQSVTFIQCQDSERIKQLLHRAVEQLQALPPLQAQQLRLVESQQVEGFEELSATMLGVMGVRPAIGFRDKWMIIGSSIPAIQKVLDTQEGSGDSFADSDAFGRFGMEIDGPVSAIKYRNLAEQIRGVAQLLQQAGMFVPMIIAGAGAQQDGPEMEVIGRLLGLLPSLGQIVAKFDFYQSSLAVAQPGSDPGTWTKRTVVLIREPGESEDSQAESPDSESDAESAEDDQSE